MIICNEHARYPNYDCPKCIEMIRTAKEAERELTRIEVDIMRAQLVRNAEANRRALIESIAVPVRAYMEFQVKSTWGHARLEKERAVKFWGALDNRRRWTAGEILGQ